MGAKEDIAEAFANYDREQERIAKLVPNALPMNEVELVSGTYPVLSLKELMEHAKNEK